MPVVEFDQECPSCKGTGLYVGMAERDGAAVVCHTCKGTGCKHNRIEYSDFAGKKINSAVRRVFEFNPGIVIGHGGEKHYSLSDFGGMPVADWKHGWPFPPGSENRKFVCPAWWYQTANYKLKPDWKECLCCGSFSSCSHFAQKEKCWTRWDKEHDDTALAAIAAKKEG